MTSNSRGMVQLGPASYRFSDESGTNEAAFACGAGSGGLAASDEGSSLATRARNWPYS
jgi:hypothetical protein